MKKVRQLGASPFLIFLAALTTRFTAAVYFFLHLPGPELLYRRNEPSYIAANLASGLGFSSPYAHTPIAATAQQPPIYPLIIAGIFKVLGNFSTVSAWAVVALHVVAASLTAILIYRLGRTYFDDTVGLVAAWLWVIPWGFQTRAFAVSFTNAYFAGLGFAALLLWLPKVMHEQRGWLRLGAFAGILLLLQPTFLAVFLVYALWLVLKARSSRMWLAAAAMVVVLIPWTARNYVDFHRFIPFRDNLGLELWVGNRPGMQGLVDYTVDFPGNDPTNFIRLGETAFMDGKLHEARAFIASEPGSFVSRFLGRFVKFWYIPYAPSWILFSILGWIGAGLALRRQPLAWLLAIPLAVYPIIYYVTHLYAGYRYPLDPVVMLLAAYAVVCFIRYSYPRWSSDEQ